MKKNIKYALLALVAVFGLASCGDEYEYTAPEAVSGAQVYFPDAKAGKVDLTIDQEAFSIPLQRVDSTQAATIDLKVDVKEGSIYTVPTSVSFEAGQKTTELVVTVDITKQEYNAKDTIVVELPDAFTTPYGASKMVIYTNCPEPWVNLGKAKFADWFFFNDFISVTVQQNMLDADLYRLVDPYMGGLNSDLGEPYLYFRLLHKGDMDPIRGQYEIPEDGMVLVYGPNSTGFTSFGISTGYKNSSYDDAIIYAVFPGAFNNYADPVNWTYTRVVGYKEDGTPGQIDFAPYYYMNGVGGWAYFDSAPTPGDVGIQIIMPGYNPKDYTVDIAAVGRFIDTKENGSAVFNITLGEDVASAKVAMAAGKDAKVPYTMIMDDAEGVVTLNASAEVRFPYQDGGDYVAVVAAYDAEGNEVAALYTLINIPVAGAAAETFEAVFVGTYTHGVKSYAQDGSIMWENQDGTPYVDDAMVLYSSTAEAGKYLLSPWVNAGYADSETESLGMTFYLNEDNTIVVPKSGTGVPSQYGEIWGWDLITAGLANIPSYYDTETGLFVFALAWSVDAGSFGYTLDTYQPTAYAAARTSKIAAKFNKNTKVSRVGNIDTDVNGNKIAKKQMQRKARNFKVTGRPVAEFVK